MNSALDYTDDIAKTAFALGRALRRRMFSSFVGSMHLGQLHTLDLIYEQPGMTMKELALALGVTSPSTTAFVDRLVKLKYVKRSHDPKNRRLVRLRITPLGLRVLTRASAEKKKMMKQMLSVLSSEDRHALSSILHKIYAVLHPH